MPGFRSEIVGDGPERPRLERASHADVTFLGRRSDEDVRELYRGAAVTLLPGEEDFGIVPVEAQACGSPVVALGRGGALETVRRRTKPASSSTIPLRRHSPTASAAR